MPHRIHLEQFANVHALPVLHYRMEFAHLVSQAVRMVSPDCIAIELPSTLERSFLRGIARLPKISVLSYEVSSASILKGKAEEDTLSTVYLIIEPADPLVEAARQAHEQELPLHLIDLDLDEYPLHHEPLPDSYAEQRIGLTAYYREFRAAFRDVHPDPEDLRRSGVEWQMVWYGGAVHSFTNPDAGKAGIKGVAHNEAADRRSWLATRSFFDEIFS